MEYILNSSMNDAPLTNLFQTFRKELHGKFDLYENFDFEAYGNTLAPGSCPSNPLLQDIVKRENPTIIIEVGSFLGYSACGMAEILKEKKKDAIVICVDTWMGGYDGWEDAINEQKFYKINKKNGYPTFYYNFLANVCYSHLQDYIVPLAFPSGIACHILKEVLDKLKTKSDMIYIDGSHLVNDVFMDCCNYYPLIKPGGLLFGDDFQFDSVKEGIKMFADKTQIHNIQLYSDNIHWQLRK